MVSGTFGRTHWQVLCSKGSWRLLQTDAHRPFHHKSQVQMTESHRRYQNHQQLQRRLVESVKVAPPTISEDCRCLVQLHLNTVGTKTQVLSLLSNICNTGNNNFLHKDIQMLLSWCLSVQETYKKDVQFGTNHNINTLLFYVHMNTSALKYVMSSQWKIQTYKIFALSACNN